MEITSMKILCIGTNSRFTSSIYTMFPTTRLERPTVILKKKVSASDITDGLDAIQLQAGMEITDELFIEALTSKFIMKEHNALGALYVRKPVTLKRVIRKKR